ncbi:MAG: metallophosphoesterase [Actinobacteria bacterium]|nr:metallophosphoesterase [Actinomycetota bacterium]
MSTMVQTVAAVGAGAAGIGAAALVTTGGRRVGGRAVLLAAVVTGALAATAAAVAGARYQDMFAVVHGGYLALMVSFPITAAGVLVRSRRQGAPRWVAPVLATAFVPIPFGVYATHIEPTWLRVDHHDVAIAPERAGEDPLTIAVLADIQTSDVGSYEHRAVREAMAAEPDLVLLPGDLFQGDRSAADTAAMRELLEELHAPGGVYFVQGDSEHGDYHDLVAGTGVTVLDDRVVEISIGDRTVRIGGTRLDYQSKGAEEVRQSLLATADDGAITILLGHRPDTALMLPSNSRVDLTVAGHTHGGQIVVPFYGPLVTMSDVPRDVARGGVGEIDGNRILVSPGIGLERGHAPQVRFGNRPAVAIVTLADEPITQR